MRICPRLVSLGTLMIHKIFHTISPLAYFMSKMHFYIHLNNKVYIWKEQIPWGNNLDLSYYDALNNFKIRRHNLQVSHSGRTFGLFWKITNNISAEKHFMIIKISHQINKGYIKRYFRFQLCSLFLPKRITETLWAVFVRYRQTLSQRFAQHSGWIRNKSLKCTEEYWGPLLGHKGADGKVTIVEKIDHNAQGVSDFKFVYCVS